MLGRPARLTLVVALAVAAACGGDGAAPTGGDTTQPGSPGSVTEGTVQLFGKTVWFAGFKVTLDSASLASSPGGGTITVAVSFENLGDNAARFDGTLSLASGGNAYSASSDQEIPLVPPGATTNGSFVFDVDDDADLDDAVLTIGLPAIHQAVVPFGSTGTLTTLEPRTMSVSGSTSAGVLTVAIESVEVRFDVPDRHTQIEKGKTSLIVKFDVTNTGSFAGGFAFGFRNNLSLKLPDGTVVAADDGPIELLAPRTTLPDQFVRFTVPDPATGSFALVVTDDTVDEQSEAAFMLG